MSDKYKYMYKKLYDDLKDADMLIHYAYEMKEEKCDDLAKHFAESAMTRLTKSFKETHALFVAHIQKEEKSRETVHECLWEVQHEQLQEWHNEIAKKIEKFK